MWKECTEERYDEMLGVLPPIWVPNGFMVGEPNDHRTCKVTGVIRPTFAAFMHFGGKFYEGPTLTVPEYKQLTFKDVLNSLA